jgi:hypothetical protein
MQFADDMKSPQELRRDLPLLGHLICVKDHYKLGRLSLNFLVNLRSLENS